MLLTSVAGCAGIDYPVAHKIPLENDQVQSISLTADLRTVHYVKRGDRYWILSEPAPDAGFAYDDDDDINLSLLSIGGKGGSNDEVNSGSDDLPLTGRASYVLLARELGYRVGEIAGNTGASFEQYSEMYLKVLDLVREIAKIEAANIRQSSDVRVRTGASASIQLDEQLGRNVSATGGARKPAPKAGDNGDSSDSGGDKSDSGDSSDSGDDKSDSGSGKNDSGDSKDGAADDKPK